ncbi:hypothetical protein GCM10027418_05310 [Mariniluteicoccus endophyticus]
MRRPLVLAAAYAGVMAWGEWVHWRASRRFLGNNPGPGDAEAVVVLGFKNRRRVINPVMKARVRAGLRSMSGPDTRLVLCGGPTGYPIPEADLMADYLVKLGHTGPVFRDRTSLDTGENIRNAIPFLEDVDRIKIVSNSVHAEMGRRYLWRYRPDLAERLVRGDDYRFGPHIWIKPALSLIGIRTMHHRFGWFVPDPGPGRRASG